MKKSLLLLSLLIASNVLIPTYTQALTYQQKEVVSAIFGTALMGTIIAGIGYTIYKDVTNPQTITNISKPLSNGELAARAWWSMHHNWGSFPPPGVIVGGSFGSFAGGSIAQPLQGAFNFR